MLRHDRISNRTGIWCCAVTAVFGFHYSITTFGHHVTYAIVFARWRQYARLGLGSYESTPNGVCITLWWFSCFTTATRKLSIVFARWHHCAKQLNHHSDADAVGCGHVRRKEACLIQACTLVPTGKYDCICYMRHECRFMEYLQTEYSSNSTTLNAKYD